MGRAENGNPQRSTLMFAQKPKDFECMFEDLLGKNGDAHPCCLFIQDLRGVNWCLRMCVRLCTSAGVCIYIYMFIKLFI